MHQGAVQTLAVILNDEFPVRLDVVDDAPVPTQFLHSPGVRTSPSAPASCSFNGASDRRPKWRKMWPSQTRGIHGMQGIVAG